MKYKVQIVEDAERDMTEIAHFLAERESVERALAVVAEIQALCASLDSIPARGNYPPELRDMGITHFRELRFKPYRIIYEVIEAQVFIHCVLDGRRDMQSLLKRRLLR